MMAAVYWVCYVLVWIAFSIWHPVHKFEGRENIPSGRFVLCGNHSGAADPLWVLLALREKKLIRIMAKYELSEAPILGWFLRKLDIIFVHRGQHDVEAFEKCSEALRQDEKLLLFVEGTRIKPGTHPRAKTGAVRLAAETHSPIVPVYVTRHRKLFCPVKVIFGEPISLSGQLKDAGVQQLQDAANDVLRTIYRLGGDTYADQVGQDSGVLLRS